MIINLSFFKIFFTFYIAFLNALTLQLVFAEITFGKDVGVWKICLKN